MKGAMVKRLMHGVAVALLAGLYVFTLAAPVNGQQCLIVRSAEGHRFRNSMIAGALTGGIGFAAGGAFGGAKYEYVDGVNVSSPKLKYKGGELQKLQQQGVHVIVINKKAQADETKSARESCKEFAEKSQPPAAPPTATPAQAAPVQMPAAPQPTTTAPANAPGVQGNAASPAPQQESLGDAARRYREQKPQQPSAAEQR
jgi:hypothetical protein